MKRASNEVGVKTWAVSLLIVAVGAQTGCWSTRGQTEALRQQVQTLSSRVGRLEGGVQKDVEKARAKVAELEEILERATRLVTKNSADVILRVGELEQQVAGVEGQLAELRHSIEEMSQKAQSARLNERLGAVEQRLGLQSGQAQSSTTAISIPEDRQAHFAKGLQAHQAGDYTSARTFFREYVTRYPKDDKADDAQYYIGSGYLAQGRAATALGELRRVLDAHPNADTADDALLDMAEAFWKLKSCADAKAAVKALIRAHPRSPLVKRARDKLKEITQAPASSCIS